MIVAETDLYKLVNSRRALNWADAVLVTATFLILLAENASATVCHGNCGTDGADGVVTSAILRINTSRPTAE
jgi:hypothetical protein